MFENFQLVVEFRDAGFFDLQGNVFLKNSTSNQPHGRRGAVAKLVNDFVSNYRRKDILRRQKRRELLGWMNTRIAASTLALMSLAR